MNQGDFGEDKGLSGGLASAGDEDVKIKNTGQRVAVIFLGLLIIAGGAAGAWWYTGKQAEIEKHEKVREAFQKAHLAGYGPFWKKVQVDIKAFKSNADFEARMKQILSEDPVRYGRFLKDEGLPILEKNLPDYKNIEAPAEYADEMANVAEAYENLHITWSAFAQKMAGFETHFDGLKKLDKAGDAWFGAQQSDKEKFQDMAKKYYAVLGCILPDQDLSEIEPTDLKLTITDSCVDDKAAWFSRVGFECLPKLAEAEVAVDEDAYRKTIAAFRKGGKEGRVDHASKFGIEDCLKATRDDYETEIIEPLAKSWAEYVKAQNELLGAIKKTLKALK